MSKIAIVNYDPGWSDIFGEEKVRLDRCVGQWVLDVEHIGSTAVPGLGSKPIIDIMIGVHALSIADKHCLAPIVGLGYAYVKEYEKQMPDRRYFKRSGEVNVLEYHVHLVEKGGEFWERHLAFRDYLCVNKETAREYERLKRFLASKSKDSNEYAVAKTDFIKNIEVKALKWRGQRIL